MKTAIIYRSNPALDSKLSGLKDKVDLFHVFPAGQEVDEDKIWELLADHSEQEKFVPAYDQLVCDLTCAPTDSIPGVKVTVIGQQEGSAEEYMTEVVQEAKERGWKVVVVLDRIADHIQLGGVKAPWDLHGDAAHEYTFRVLSAWEEACRGAGVEFEEIYAEDLIETGKKYFGTMIVCDHHNGVLARKLGRLAEEGKLIYKNSFPYGQKHPYRTLDELPILLQK